MSGSDTRNEVRPDAIVWRGRLGVPYKGSKNRIAMRIVSLLPPGRRFVDLFAGGCAMTHAAMLSGKYERFLANDIHGFGIRLFVDAIAGRCNGRAREWVSKEEFHAKKDSDPLISLCWSFGNDGSTYLYGVDKEALKRSAHEGKINGVKSQSKIEVENLERLQALERSVFEFRTYEDFGHEAGDVVYCDPPYKSADSYRFLKRRGIKFDNDAFWDWASSRDYPVFVSEYTAPDGWTQIWSTPKKAMMGRSRDGHYKDRVERLFVQNRFADGFVRRATETVNPGGAK